MCGAQWVRMTPAARVADGRHMIDVHTEPQGVGLDPFAH
jgi:hypothetical protein